MPEDTSHQVREVEEPPEGVLMGGNDPEYMDSEDDE